MASINLNSSTASIEFEKELTKNLRKKMRNVKGAFKEISQELVDELKVQWPRSGKSNSMADNFDFRLRLSYVKGYVNSIMYNKTKGSLIHFIETGTIFQRPQRIIRNIWDKNQEKYDRIIQAALEK